MEVAVEGINLEVPMKKINLTVPAAWLLTLSLGAVPVFAESPHAHAREQGGERSGGARESGRAQERVARAGGAHAR
jgi:hypothetical protein